jgi:hypothetical protein
MIHSIIGSIVWCFPTSRVFIIIKEILHIFVLYILWFFVFSLWYLTIGIKELFLVGIVGNFVFSVCNFFWIYIYFWIFEENEDRDILDDLYIFMCQIFKQWLYI